MESKRRRARTHILTTLALILALMLVSPAATPATAVREVPPLRATAGVDQPRVETTASAGLTVDEQATMLDLIREAQYQFTWQVSNGEWAYRAPNQANDLSLSLAADGFHAARYSAAGEPLWDLSLSLAAYGEQTFPAAIGGNSLVGTRERVEYRWSEDVVEWYTNSAAGVEHGLTLAAPPAGVDGSTVELTFALRGSLTLELDSRGQSLRLKDANGETALIYDQLAVYDATGKSLPAHMRLSQGLRAAGLHLVIDAAGAIYPLTVDPMLHGQAAKLTAGDPEENDDFGWSVAISGDTVVVGAYREDGVGSERGAAYVFTRNEGGNADSWGQVSKISAAPLKDGAFFGRAVAISGDTIVVGAAAEDDVGVGNCATGADCGAAYVFERNKNGTDMWGQVERLTAGTNADAGAFFGNSVSISVDTIVVGASDEDGFGDYRGAAYIFERNRGGAENWNLRKRLVASPQQDNAVFGRSVAISDDTIIVGAYKENDGGLNKGAAYVFQRNKDGAEYWGQVQTLVASDAEDGDYFGVSVAISGDTAAVGAYLKDNAGINQGAAYIFERNQGGIADNWGQVTKLTATDTANGDHFGTSVAISGDTVVIGADGDDGPDGWGQGAAYLFERHKNGPDGWGQVSKLTADDAEADDYFGNSVAISGNTVVAGAWGKNDGGDSNLGAAYLFVRGDSQWQEVSTVHASEPGNDDRFGFSVAISGDTAVVGADWADEVGLSCATGTDCGVAYVFERNQGRAASWGEAKKLLSIDIGTDDYFGCSVAISGDTIVVGASGENAGGVDRGAAYVFERNRSSSSSTTPLADNWGQVAKLEASVPGNQDYFGSSVAISGDTVVVGAPGEQGGTGSDRGAAYIFARNRGGANAWDEVKMLLSGDEQDDGYFGTSVAISGDTVVVGAYGEDGSGDPGSERGAAYVFERNKGGADQWDKVQKLEASAPDDGDHFGCSVAISNDTVVVGADQEDGLGGDNLGAAYVFERNKNGGDQWGLVKKLAALDPADNDYFGVSVAISGDTVVVGAHKENATLFSYDRGAAYVFERNYFPNNPDVPQADHWGEVTKLTASDRADHDYFGRSVSISSDQIVVGAYGQDGEDSAQGAAYFFRLEPLRDITVLPGILDFGPQATNLGPTPSQAVTITNDGTVDLNISGVSLTGPDTAEFIIVSDSGEGILAPGATRTVQVAFDPSSEGVKTAYLSIVSDDDGEPTVHVALSGSGVFLPEITVSPGSLHFGHQDTDAGPTAPKTVTISNDGEGKLFISSAGLTGTDAAEFVIWSDSAETMLMPGETRTVQVSFDPSSTGAKSAYLTIASNDSDEPTVDVTLSGNKAWSVFLPIMLNNH